MFDPAPPMRKPRRKGVKCHGFLHSFCKAAQRRKEKGIKRIEPKQKAKVDEVEREHDLGCRAGQAGAGRRPGGQAGWVGGGRQGKLPEKPQHLHPTTPRSLPGTPEPRLALV